MPDAPRLLRNLASSFAAAKRDFGDRAGRVAKNAGRMMARLRRLSKRAEHASKSGAGLGEIKLKTEKFIQKKKLETSKTGKNGTLRPVSLMNELQAVADMHATLLGAGRGFCRDNNITWVVTHYVIDIPEMPGDKEELSFITWPVDHEQLRATRDFEVRGADGRPMVRAASQWIMIDLAARRPVKLAEYMPDWECLPERALDAAFEKFADFDAPNARDFDVRYDDFDVNQHVNNAVYATWATESLGVDFLDSHKLRGLKINFKKEIPAGTEKVSVGYETDGKSSRHVIRSGGAANAIVICEWE
jgi:medium-chain acyl-[acyl-carrier-protein] hydrolase